MFDRLKSMRRKIKSEVRLYQLLLRDSRTPGPAKLFLWLAAGYLLSPFDIIPDFIPVIGCLDDAIIVPVLVIVAFKMIPGEVVEDCRKRANCV